LLVGVAGRAYCLCVSFHAVPDGQTIFGPYFLVPLAAAIGLLVLVAAARHGTLLVRRLTLLLPIVWLSLATIRPTHDATFLDFLGRFESVFGASPVVVALGLTAAYYVVAFFFRVPNAFGLLVNTVAAVAVIHGSARSLVDPQTAIAWPLAAAAALTALRGVWRRDLFWCSVAVPYATLAAYVGFSGVPRLPTMFVSLHTFILGSLAVGLLFPDARGRVPRLIGGGFLLLGVWAALTHRGAPLFDALPPWSITVYPLAAIAVACVIAAVCRDRISYAIVVGLVGEWLAVAGGREYLRLRRLIAGLDAIALGLAAFAAAVGLSLTKLDRSRRIDAETRPETQEP
jgi:hypothetical protein